MKKYLIIVGIVVLVLLGLQQYLILSDRPEDFNKELIKKIDKLESKIDSLTNKRDSVKTLIIRVENRIKENEKNYEETVNSILLNNDSVNRVFIDGYIKQYIEQISQ